MDKLLIEGGTPLTGEIRVSGAKNAALPILCAALLSREPLVLTNVARLNDVRTMQTLLAQMGVRLDARAPGELTLDAAAIDWPLAPYELVKTMRASILALGPLVARERVAEVAAAAEAREKKEEANRKRLAAGELGIDLYGMRDALAKAGLEYID